MPNDSAVNYFELTLLWPLRFFVPKRMETSTENTGDALDQLVEVMTGGNASPWHEVKDTLVRDRRHPANPGESHCHSGETPMTHYSEGVYFHPFIQKLLYGTGTPDGRPPFRLLTREDIQVVQVTIKPQQPFVTYDVRKVDLYLFSSEVAVLVVSILGKSCTFGDYLTLSAWLRRSYPPFWSKYQKEQSANDRDRPGFCPFKVVWGHNLGASAESNYDDIPFFTDSFEKTRTPTPAKHWKFLLEPMEIWGGVRDGKLRYQLLGDERIPVMSFVAFSDIRKLNRGDWMRIAACEASGSWHLPYAEAFLSDFEAKHCYDRFWSQKGWQPGPMDENYLKELTTRFLVSEHSFSIALEPTGSKPWSMETDDGLRAHFRHHYFQLCLLAHVQNASLQVFSDRLADSVRGNTEQYASRIAVIAKEFALFMDRFWVGEITNQIQGKELFELQVNRLGTAKLFVQVKSEIDFVHQYLTGWRNERVTKGQIVLAKVAYWGLSVSALLSFLGMNVFIDPSVQWLQSWGWSERESHWTVFLGSCFSFWLIAQGLWEFQIKPGMRGQEHQGPSKS